MTVRPISRPCRGTDHSPSLWEHWRRRHGCALGHAAGQTISRPSGSAGDGGVAVLRAVPRGGRPSGPLGELATSARPSFGPWRGADVPPALWKRWHRRRGRSSGRCVERTTPPALATVGRPFFGPCRGADGPPALWERWLRGRGRSSVRAAGRRPPRLSGSAGDGGATVLRGVPRDGRPSGPLGARAMEARPFSGPCRGADDPWPSGSAGDAGAAVHRGEAPLQESGHFLGPYLPRPHVPLTQRDVIGRPWRQPRMGDWRRPRGVRLRRDSGPGICLPRKGGGSMHLQCF